MSLSTASTHTDSEASETIVVTGANRGIGLEFARRFLERGSRVIAGCRKPEDAHELRALGTAESLDIFPLELDSESSVSNFAQQISDTPIDVLINNAGVMGGSRQDIDDIDYAEWLQTLRINSLAPLQVALALRAKLERSDRPRIVTISSKMGALASQGTGALAYRSSKAAVNKIMQVLAQELAAQSIIVCPVHPGWVRTDMGGSGADISVEESVAGLIQLIDGLQMADSGTFFNWDGTELAW